MLFATEKATYEPFPFTLVQKINQPFHSETFRKTRDQLIPKDLACILQASGLDVHGSFVADRVNGDVKDVGLGASLDDLFLDKIDPVVAGHCTMLFDVEHVSYLQTAENLIVYFLGKNIPKKDV